MICRIEGLPKNPVAALPQRPEVATIHARNSVHGCLAARVEQS
jgi:hypothetical protein